MSKAKFQGKTAKCKLSPGVHDITYGCVIRRGMNLKGQDGTMNLVDWNGPWRKVTISGIIAGEERKKELQKSQGRRLKAERLLSGEADKSTGLSGSLRPVHSCSGLGPGLFIRVIISMVILYIYGNICVTPFFSGSCQWTSLPTSSPFFFFFSAYSWPPSHF